MHNIPKIAQHQIIVVFCAVLSEMQAGRVSEVG
jgi:hypothetical protein